MSADEHLVKDVIRFVEVKDYIELTYITEVPIKNLHEKMNLLQYYELVIILVDASNEK